MDEASNLSHESTAPSFPETASPTVDMSVAFLRALQGDTAAWFQFDDELRKFRTIPELTISVDWSTLSADPTRTQGMMRWMKALAEGGRGQRRQLIIRGSRAERDTAARIEANVLSSGIRWEFSDEALA